MTEPASDGTARQRLDKWLWQARFVKTRSLAAKLVAGGHVRVNSDKASKPALQVGPGDVLTFPQGDLIRVVRIAAIGMRRGPAREAQTLFEDLAPPAEQIAERRDARDARPPRYEGKGRPTKRDRRAIDRAKRAEDVTNDIPPSCPDENG